MFNKRTLFIVGAGASAEYKLPVGNELASRISKRLDVNYDRYGREPNTGDLDLWHQIHHAHQTEVNEYQQAAWLVRDGVDLSNSIDDFLDVHAQNTKAVEVGKAAIVRSILDAERHSRLFFKRDNIYAKFKFGSIADTWLVKLMRTLGRGVPPERAKSIFNNVAFIVFNYDRCIEHFFFTALKQFYNLKDAEASELMETLKIYHPYGKVAPLEYEDRKGIPYGGGPDELRAPYVTLSSGIRTYTERIEESEKLFAMREEMDKAQKIIYLGFAFHEQNLKLLKPLDALGRKQIYGTAFGMSPNDVAVVKARLAAEFNDRERHTIEGRIFLEPSHTCAHLFDFYAKSLPD